MKLKIILFIGLLIASQFLAAQYQWFSGQNNYSNQRSPHYQMSPAQLLKSKMDTLLRFLNKQDGLSDGQLRYFLVTEVAPVFDFDYMTKMAVGNAYSQLGQARRDAMVFALTERFLKTMIARLTSYDNQRIHYLAQRISRDGRTATVGVAILGGRGYPARLDFRFYKGDAGWKVYDVLANGQSAVVHYRTQFRKMIRSFAAG